MPAVVPPPPKHLVGGIPVPRIPEVLHNTSPHRGGVERCDTRRSSLSVSTHATASPRVSVAGGASGAHHRPVQPAAVVSPSTKERVRRRMSVNESVVPLYDNHLGKSEVEDGVASGEFVLGTMRVSAAWGGGAAYVDAQDDPDGLVLSAEGTKCIIMLPDTAGDVSYASRNRALPGDLVVVRSDLKEVSRSLADAMHWDDGLRPLGVVLGTVVSIQRRSNVKNVFATITEEAVDAANSSELYAVATPLNPSYPKMLFPSVAVGLFLGASPLSNKQAVVELTIRKEWPPNLRLPICDLATVIALLPLAATPRGLTVSPLTPPLTSPRSPLSQCISPPSNTSLNPGFHFPQSSTHPEVPSSYYLEETLALRELGVLALDKEHHLETLNFGSYVEGETPYMRDKLNGVDLEEALEHMRWIQSQLAQGRIEEAVEDIRDETRAFTLCSATDEDDAACGTPGEFDNAPQQVAYSCAQLGPKKDGDPAAPHTTRHRVGVHILDIGELIAETGPLEQLLKRRLSTVRLPHAVFPLLPARVREEASLKPGEAAPCISVMWTVTTGRGEPASISDVWVGATTVHVRCGVRESHLAMLASGCPHFPCPIFGINEHDNPVVLRGDVLAFIKVMRDSGDLLHRTGDRRFRFMTIRNLFAASEGVHAPGAAGPLRNPTAGGHSDASLRSPKTPGKKKHRVAFSPNLVETTFDPSKDLYRIVCGQEAMEGFAKAVATELPLSFRLRKAVEGMANQLSAESTHLLEMPGLIPAAKAAYPAQLFTGRKVVSHIFADCVPRATPTAGLLSPYLRSWKVRKPINEDDRTFRITQPMDSYVNIIVLRMMRRLLKANFHDKETRTQKTQDHVRLANSVRSNCDLGQSVDAALAADLGSGDAAGGGDGGGGGGDGDAQGGIFYHSPVREAGIGRWKPTALKQLYAQDAAHTVLKIAAYERLLDVTKAECLSQAGGTHIRVVGEYMGLRGSGESREVAVYFKEWGVMRWLPLTTKGDTVVAKVCEDDKVSLLFEHRDSGLMGSAETVPPYGKLFVAFAPSLTRPSPLMDSVIQPTSEVPPRRLPSIAH
eukprot:TRINITY_DN11322_c0_g1_i2.p1 TRINITY_DN11322_c0_g1~~TRINITY_DN11322_c0_g1_i2.p1  ORF type:complete len:1122 (+),score=395.45 TRINITY_DN11322_c0_g1_i2:169-3366(+)